MAGNRLREFARYLLNKRPRCCSNIMWSPSKARASSPQAHRGHVLRQMWTMVTVCGELALAFGGLHNAGPKKLHERRTELLLLMRRFLIFSAAWISPQRSAASPRTHALSSSLLTQVSCADRGSARLSDKSAGKVGLCPQLCQQRAGGLGRPHLVSFEHPVADDAAPAELLSRHWLFIDTRNVPAEPTPPVCCSSGKCLRGGWTIESIANQPGVLELIRATRSPVEPYG